MSSQEQKIYFAKLTLKPKGEKRDSWCLIKSDEPYSEYFEEPKNKLHFKSTKIHYVKEAVHIDTTSDIQPPKYVIEGAKERIHIELECGYLTSISSLSDGRYIRKASLSIYPVEKGYVPSTWVNYWAGTHDPISKDIIEKPSLNIDMTLTPEKLDEYLHALKNNEYSSCSLTLEGIEGVYIEGLSWRGYHFLPPNYSYDNPDNLDIKLKPIGRASAATLYWSKELLENQILSKHEEFFNVLNSNLKQLAYIVIVILLILIGYSFR